MKDFYNIQSTQQNTMGSQLPLSFPKASSKKCNLPTRTGYVEKKGIQITLKLYIGLFGFKLQKP